MPCYSDQKVEEYLDRVEKLKGCYKAFCGKLRRLDTSFDDIPWTERGYKRPLSDTVEEVPLETNEPGMLDSLKDTMLTFWGRKTQMCCLAHMCAFVALSLPKKRYRLNGADCFFPFYFKHLQVCIGYFADC